MRQFASSLPLYLLLLILQRISSVRMVQPYSLKTVIIEENNGKSCRNRDFMKVKGMSGYVYSHDPKNPVYQQLIQCVLSIEAPEGYRIVLEALAFDLGYPPKPQRCQNDSLFVFDNQPKDGKIVEPDLKMLGEFCSVENRTILATSSKNSITLYWHAVPIEQRYPSAKGFVLKWYVLRQLTTEAEVEDGCDTSSEFSCANQRMCIPIEFACDKIPQCNDGSDLIKHRQIAAGCENIQPDSIFADLSGAAIAGIIISCIVISVLIIVILVCCCISNRRRSRQSSRNNLSYQPAPTMALPVGSNGGMGTLPSLSLSNGGTTTVAPTAASAQLSSSSGGHSFNNNKNFALNGCAANNRHNYNNHYHQPYNQQQQQRLPNQHSNHYSQQQLQRGGYDGHGGQYANNLTHMQIPKDIV